MTETPKDKDTEAKGLRVQIIVAIIAMFSAIVVAVISNWDKIFQPGSTESHSITAPDHSEAPVTGNGAAALSAPVPRGEDCDVTVRTPQPNHYFIIGWQSVDDAATYSIEYDCFGCREHGRNWHSIAAGFPWHRRTGLGFRTAIYSSKIHNQLKEEEGIALRWRVWAVDHDGDAGDKSEWCKISFGGSLEQ